MSDHNPALPPGWSEHWSRTAGRLFYKHIDSGHTQWERPVDETVRPKGKQWQDHRAGNGNDTEEEDLPIGWKVHRSKATGKVFYRNSRTGQTQSTFPSESRADLEPKLTTKNLADHVGQRNTDHMRQSQCNISPLRGEPFETENDRAPQWLSKRGGPAENTRIPGRSVSPDDRRGGRNGTAAKGDWNGRQEQRNDHVDARTRGAADASEQKQKESMNAAQRRLPTRMGAGGPKKETPSSHHYHFVQRSATSGAKQPTVQAAQTKVQDPAQKTAMTAKDTKTMTVKDTPRLLEGAAAEQRDESLLRLLKSRDGSFRTMLLMEEAEAREDEEHGHHPHPHHRHQHRKPHKAQREVQSEQKARAATSAVHPGQRQRRLSMSMNMNHLASQVRRGRAGGLMRRGSGECCCKARRGEQRVGLAFERVERSERGPRRKRAMVSRG